MSVGGFGSVFIEERLGTEGLLGKTAVRVGSGGRGVVAGPSEHCDFNIINDSITR